MKQRILLFCVAGSCVAAIANFVAMSAARRYAASFARVEKYLSLHEAELADAVRAAVNTGSRDRVIPIESLPLALHAPDVQAAYAGARHVTLVVNSNPDTDRGFRIWADHQSGDYDDTPTSVSDVYRFSYCDDYPQSPTNRFP